MDGGTKTRLALEMRSPAQVVGAGPDARIRFREVEDNDELLVRIVHEVGDPHLWSAESWAGCGSPPANRHWLIEVDDESGGLLDPCWRPMAGLRSFRSERPRGSSPGRMSSQQASIPRTCQPPDGARLGNGPLFGDGVEEGADARLAVRPSRPPGWKTACTR